jgi:nitrate reductase NapE component
MKGIEILLFVFMAVEIILYFIWLGFFCKAKEVSSLRDIVVQKCYYPPHWIIGESDRHRERRIANLLSVVIWTILACAVIVGFIFT